MASLFKRRNGFYYQVVTLHGRRIWRSTGARSINEAEKFLRKRSKPRKPHTPKLTLSQFTPQCLKFAETNFATSTVLLYKQVIQKFIEVIGDFQLKAYTVQDVEAFKAKRLAQVSPVKVNIDFRTMKACFQTALRWKFISENPFREMKQIRVPQERPIYLSKDAFQKLLDAIQYPWFKKLVIFAVCTMMRAGEIVSLTWDSIDLRRRIDLPPKK